MWKNLQETADLVTFTEEILNGQIHFITSASFKIDNVVLWEAKSERRQPDPNIFLQIAASAAVAAAVNPNGTKTLLDNGFSNFLLKAIQVLVMVLNVYLKIFLIVLFYATEILIILY